LQSTGPEVQGFAQGTRLWCLPSKAQSPMSAQDRGASLGAASKPLVRCCRLASKGCGCTHTSQSSFHSPCSDGCSKDLATFHHSIDFTYLRPRPIAHVLSPSYRRYRERCPIAFSRYSPVPPPAVVALKAHCASLMIS